ncbi:MAG: roadblock/LC7 domain-containing protein [Candidatus Baldrarchaeia archaeon]
MEQVGSVKGRIEEEIEKVMKKFAFLEGVAVISMEGFLIACKLPQNVDGDLIAASTAAVQNICEKIGIDVGKGGTRAAILEYEGGYVITSSLGENFLLTTIVGNVAGLKLGMVFLALDQLKKAIGPLLGKIEEFVIPMGTGEIVTE